MEYVIGGLIVLALAATFLIKPKTEKPKAATLSDFSVPTAEENRAIPVVFGTRLISGANVVWYGDLRTREIREGGGKK